MEDEIRDGVQDAINKFYYAQTNIRVLSGDHKDTVVNLAVNLQIIEHNNEAGVMAGDYLTHQLYQLLEYKAGPNSSVMRWRFKDAECKKTFVKSLKQVLVVYRATPEMKLLFTSAFRDLGDVVAVTGESISDCQALREADVGFCMGQGCAVAKNEADIIFMDDNFSCVFAAIKWGRNIFENCRKFIMF